MRTRHQNLVVRRFVLLLLSCGWIALALVPAHTVRVAAESKPEARGAELFATKGCAQCHGADGVGGGRGPDLQLVRKRMHADGIATQIRDGGKAMPSYGDTLAPQEITDLVAYLRMKRKHIVQTPAHPPASTDTPKPRNPDDDA